MKILASVVGLAIAANALVACGGDDDANAGSSGAGGSGGSPSTSNGGSTSSTSNGSGGSTASGGSMASGGTSSESAGGAAGASGGGPKMNIVELASSNDDFDTLVQALVDTGLDDDLAGEGPFTVFAPTDAAFALLPEGLLESLDEDTLSDILLYHVVQGAVPAAEVVDLETATTLQGDQLDIMVDGDSVVLNGLVQVTSTDIMAENGIIHAIDAVLIPGAFPGNMLEAVSAYPRLSTLAGAVTPDVADALTGDALTLFAPVNSAFEGVALPEATVDLEDILLYHAIPAEVPAAVAETLASAQMANGAFIGVKSDDGLQLFDGSKNTKVTYADIEVDNGVMHVIDQVLSPPGTIAEVAVAAGLTSLVDALGAADVPGSTTSFADAAAGEGPLTVFAPSNEAFDRIPGDLGGALPDVLGAHVIPAAVDSASVAELIANGEASPATLTGSDDDTHEFSLGPDGPLVNHMVRITATDIPARNGLVHLVDSVILPSDVVFPGNLVEAVSAYPNFSSLVDAVTNADPAVATALTGTDALTLFAPENSAFAGIDTTEDLTDVLLYHALPVEADSSFVVANFLPAATTPTAAGSDVTIDADALTVNDSNIVRVDFRTDNGVIHVIDSVLTPPEQ